MKYKIWLAASIMCCASLPVSAVTAVSFTDLNEKLILDYTGSLLTAEDFQVTNDTNDTWTDFHLFTEGTAASADFEYAGFFNYSGPGTTTYKDVNGDAQGRFEVLDIVDLSIAPSASYTFTVSVTTLPPEGATSIQIYGRPTVDGNGTPSVPEPATLSIFGIGMGALAWLRRRKTLV